ncbi:MAG: TIGR03752 family integrating conjugative element protein [Pseudomonadota bacterium]
MGANKWVQYGAATLLLIVVLISLKSCGDGAPVEEKAVSVGGGAPISAEALEGLAIEADTPQDVVATLIGQVRELRTEQAELISDNRALRDDNAQLKGMEQTIGRRMESRVNEASAKVRRDAEAQYQQMIRRLEDAETRLRRAEEGRTEPSMFTLDNPDVAGITWVHPLGSANTAADGFDDDGGFLASLDGARDSLSDRIGRRDLTGRRASDEAFVPYFTIPRNATLVSSTAMTALVGRVPLGGQVTDPYSFKVIIGQDNLMANGIELPEVSYAIASGKAVGDWTLGCVRGDLFSLTFVFEDGTIRTVPKAPDIYEGTAQVRDIKIGELSDRFGNPCVLGERISNAFQYLSQRIGVVSVQAAAEAAAASQTTQVTSVGGGGAGVATFVDGDTGQFVLGRSIADSANEVARWLDERQAQQFDAVYVPPGADVSMHITEQIEIDYDPNGRKTNHAALLTGGYRALD